MGKSKYIESPEALMNHFRDYVKLVKENPIKKHDFVGKNADEVWRQIERPLTMHAFECYLCDFDIIKDIGDYFSNKKNIYSEFVPVCLHIRRSIRQDQIEGGMVGIYDPSITQQLNGLERRIVKENKNQTVVKIANLQ